MSETADSTREKEAMSDNETESCIDIANRLLHVGPGQRLHEDLALQLHEVDTMVQGGAGWGKKLRSAQVVASIIVQWKRAEVSRLAVVAE